MNSAEKLNQNTAFRETIKRRPFGFEAEERQKLPWLLDIRERAYERFGALGFPTRKSETWKYIHLDPILNSPFLSAETNANPAAEDENGLKPYLFSESESNRLVFLNGVHSAKLSSARNLPAGCILENLSTALEKNPALVKTHLAKNISEEQNPFAMINAFCFREGVFLYLAKNCEIKEPIHLVFLDLACDPKLISHPRLLVVADQNSKATLVLNHVGLSKGQTLMNGAVEIHLAKEADLKISAIQRNAYQFLTWRTRLHEGSRFDLTSIHLNGIFEQNDIQVDFEGAGASCSLSGLSVLEGFSQVFHHALVNHRAPNCTSRQLYKSILADEAKSEFNSLVHVLPGAQKSDSNQLNRNLLLSESARVFSRPQLKIYADDVKATHGSATGQLAKDELFYLRSRGLTMNAARHLLTYGFAKEVLELICPVNLRKQLENAVEMQLGNMVKKESV